MLGDKIADFLKEILSDLKRIFSSRMIPFVIISMALFAILIYRLFILQIVNGEYYSENYTLQSEKTVTTTGTRGNIYDKNNVLLAYSELAYSVVIEDSGYYSTNNMKNEALNEIIASSVYIIQSHGDTLDYDFSIFVNEENEFEYSLSGESLKRFLRDIYGYQAVSELSDEEINAKASETVEYLKLRYEINDTYDNEMTMNIIYIRYNLAANSYKRYVSFTLASDVSAETMAAILENSDTLTGVGIEENSIRKYNYSIYMAHIIGYTGKINTTELEELELIDDSYTATDVVGKSGIESEYETTLAGTKGSETLMVDNVGRVLEVTDSVEAVAGQDVYLSIDVELQKEVYELLERRLAETLVSRIVDSDSDVGPDEQIVIPITDVYFALIDNNTIDMSLIATSETETATSVYTTFSNYKTQVLEDVSEELNNGILFNSLTSDMQEYITLLRRSLINNNIINTEDISSTDEAQAAWLNGTISLHDYLDAAISNDWINIYNLDVSSDYPTKDEVMEAIINEIIDETNTNNDFDKLVYKYLVTNHIVTGRQLCLLLMEQDAVSYTESEYINIYNGGSTFTYLVEKIDNLEITPAQLALDPCSGSCTIEDPNTGELLAMVSYPSYDINYFSGSIDADYYAGLLDDKSTPLVNRATMTKIAPGSTFKPLMAIAALNEGVISTTETVLCDGEFDKVTPGVKCWVYPSGHGDLDTIGALANSCNVYFCEVGYRLSITANGTFSTDYGLSRIEKYTELLGLSTKTGIQLPEVTPHASDYNPIASSIGQGTNAYTSLNLARYISTIANEGTVYDSSIISKIVDTENQETYVYEPIIANTVEIDQTIWDTVKEGMRQVISSGVMNELCETLPVTIEGKSGTAQEDKTRGDHAVYVMISSDEEGNSELVTTVMIPYGYASTNAGIMAYYATASYYDTEIPSSIYFSTNYTVDITE